MKRRINRQIIETLYIFGAGSSKALSDVKRRKKDSNRSCTPIDKDFLQLLNHFSLKIGWQKTALELVNKGWLGSTEMIEHGLEDAIIKRVANYDLLSSLAPDNSRKKCSNEEYLNNLSHLITDYLLKCKSNSSGRTKYFINKIFPKESNINEYRNRIITFNYDLIIDRPLLERGISKKKIYFDRIVTKKDAGTRRYSTEIFQHPLILKMHGSINWRCDTDYFNQIIKGEVDRKIKIPIWSNDTKCPSPVDNESPLIIPPIPNKPITKARIFNFIWTTAFEYLHEAEKIVIVGYSCPETDSLAQSMFSQFRNKKVKEIVIVDPSPYTISRFSNLLSTCVNKNTKLQYYRGFNEYIDQELS